MFLCESAECLKNFNEAAWTHSRSVKDFKSLNCQRQFDLVFSGHFFTLKPKQLWQNYVPWYYVCHSDKKDKGDVSYMFQNRKRSFDLNVKCAMNSISSLI